MAEYIEREALFIDIFGSVVFSVRNEPSAEMRGANKILDRIKCAPAADVVPVVHGRWINEGVYVTTAYGSLDVYSCSVCGSEITIDGFDSYCPNCGAKMDLE